MASMSTASHWVYLGLLFSECVDRLGMQNGDIKDNQITASSSRPADLPHYGRLNNNKFWCAGKKNKNEYLQVDLGQVKKIRPFADMAAILILSP